MTDVVDTFLEHHGVKGMKWGKKTAPTEKRRAYKARISSERQAFYQKHLSDVLDTSLKKGERVLVRTHLPGDYVPTVMTGKQFVDYASRSGLLDAKMTDIFARQDPKSKQYVLNGTPTPKYIPSKRM